MQLFERRRFSFIAQTLLDQSHISQVYNHCECIFWQPQWINRWFKSWVILQGCWAKIHSELNSGLKRKMLYGLFLLDTSPFLSAQADHIFFVYSTWDKYVTLCWTQMWLGGVQRNYLRSTILQSNYYSCRAKNPDRVWSS